MSGWLTPQSLVAVILVLVFLAVAALRPRRAVLMYTILGATPPVLQLGAFSGRTISQGLLLAEVLGTALVAVWLVKRSSSRPLLQSTFDGPLLAFAAACVASLAAAQMLPDPRIEETTSLAVSLGQLLLVCWPIGVYWASAEMLSTTAQLQAVLKVILLLSLGQFAAPFMPPGARDYMAWTPTFSIFAAPFALASALATRAHMARVALLVIAVAPLVRGVIEGKAFTYGFVLAACGTILWLRASRAVVAVAGVVLAIALFFATIGREQLLSGPLSQLVETERSQSSYGGRTGRGQIALDTLSIWQDAPALGVGPSNSYLYLEMRGQIGTPHNQYLNILVEFGLLGLVTWCWFLGATFTKGLEIYRSTVEPFHRTFVLGWLGLFAGLAAGGLFGDYMIHSIRNGGLELFSGYYLQWVLLGGLIAVARLERHARMAPLGEPVARPVNRGRTFLRPPRVILARHR